MKSNARKRLTAVLISSTTFMLTVASFSPAPAQGFGSAAPSKWQTSLQFLVGVPQGQFNTNVGNNGYGFSVLAGYAPQASSFIAGVELGYLNYGSQSRFEAFNPNIPEVRIKVDTDNSILLAHLVLRVQPNAGTLRPYAEGLGGLNYLFTRSSIQDAGSLNRELASTTNFDDTAWSYGAGGGLMLRVYQKTNGIRRGLQEVLIDVRARYLIGTEAEYLKKGPIQNQNGVLVYDVQKSETDLLTYQLGATLRF